MAYRVGFAAAAVLVLALAGCGKPSGTGSEQPAQPSEPASAPAELTPAQKTALLAELPARYQTADLANGETKFAVCRACHTNVEGGENMVGPALWGIFGRKAGSKADFSYSDDLHNAAWTWDADHLDTWLTNPRAMLAGTKMTFLGYPDPKDRTDLIAYLKVSTSPAPAGAAAPAAAAANSTH